MPKTTPWHSQPSQLDRVVSDVVYHNHSECKVGAPIRTKHRVDGTGDLKQ